MMLHFPLRLSQPIPLPFAFWRLVLALAAIVGLTNGAGATPTASLECTVTGAAEPGFAEAFCRSLAEALSDDLAIAGPETALKTGHAIVVAVTLLTERSARVDIATSRLTDGIASDKRRSETNLVAHDGPLRAKSAATLAFPIVRQVFGK